MRLEPFVCEVKKISYHTIENAKTLSSYKFYCKLDVEAWENAKGDSVDRYEKDDNVYIANATVIEKTQGKQKRKKTYNVNLYLSKEEFDNKVIEIGDRLRIEKGKLATDCNNIIVYDMDKIKEYPKQYITRSENGYPQVKLNIIACKISVEEGGWKIANKSNNAHYFNIDKNYDVNASKIKFYVEDNKQLLNNNEYNFYLDDDEAEALVPINNEIVDLNFYSHRQIKQKATAELKVIFDDKIGRYYAYITNINRFEK